MSRDKQFAEAVRNHLLEPYRPMPPLVGQDQPVGSVERTITVGLMPTDGKDGNEVVGVNMIRQTVEKMNLPVAEADNGVHALSWLNQHPLPAVILLDLMMPQMDGFEVLDALAAHAQWRDIPVIVLTAKQLTAAERERLLGQARKVIEKGGASRLDIVAAINEAVRRRPVRAAADANA